MATKRTKTDYENAAMTSQSIAGLWRYFGLKPCGGNYKIIHKAIKEYDLDISHFTGQGWNTDLHFKPAEAKPIEDILVADSNYQSYKLKRRLIQEGLKDNICERCRLSEWQGAPIPLELHHINGNNRDNRLENLALLCPNCHALTESYRGKNKSRWLLVNPSLGWRRTVCLCKDEGAWIPQHFRVFNLKTFSGERRNDRHSSEMPF